jgi:GH24 family phage-related lysozyme (muramidase)
MRLLDFFTYYRKRTPHQDAAIAMLEEAINKADASILGRDAEWYKTWQAGGKVEAAPDVSGDLGPALAMIKKFEGCYLKAYNDGVGIPTIGWGTIKYPNGRHVAYGDVITQEQADQYLAGEAKYTYDTLAKTIPHWGEMNANQRGALTSFAYNLGANFYGNGSFNTITRYLRERRWKDVPEALMLYRNPGTNVEAGLKRRRVAEGVLWLA